MKKRLMAFLLLYTFVFSIGSIGLLPVTSVKATENPYSKKEKEIPKTDKIYYAETDEDEFIAVQRALANHEKNFTIRYLASKEDEFSYYGMDNWDAWQESDGLYWSDSLYANASYGMINSEGEDWKESYVNAKGQEWFNLDYDYNYWESYSEYQELYKEIRNLIVDSGVATKSDYEKAKWAYDWICSNVSYDYNYKIYDAYGAFKNKKAVCEGYSRLFEAFAGELGLNSRYVSGVANNGAWNAHAWNIVEFDGKWYQLDTTWGATHGSKYFLKGSNSFDIDHRLSDITLGATLNLASSDFVSSTQNSGVPARLYDINLDPVYMERLNFGEEYNWLVSSNDADIKLEFSNSNSDIVSLSDNGKVKALKSGKATLIAENKELGIKQTIDITVSKEKATVGDYTTIKSANDVSVVYGKTAQIKLTLKDKDGKLQNVSYTSSDKTIATVDKNGKVKGVKAGTTYVTISYTGGDKVKVKVTVNPVINKKTATVQVKKQISLRDAVIISKDGYKDLKFTSSNKSIVTVSATGYATGVKKGTATINIYDKNINKLIGAVKVTVK